MPKTAPKAIVRFLPDDPPEWEEACIQFQGAPGEYARQFRELVGKNEMRVRLRHGLVYCKADRAVILKVLKGMGFTGSNIIDVLAPTPQLGSSLQNQE